MKAIEAAVVIPARLEAQRFPRKVLARDTGKYLIQHVYEAVVGAEGVQRVIIATDSAEVLEAARSFGAEACLTSPDHLSGTDRVAEVAKQLDEDVLINVQGDEPLLRQEDLTALVDVFRSALSSGQPAPEMATLARLRGDVEGYVDPNIVKVVVDRSGRALYFSRSPLPGCPAGPTEKAAGVEVEWLHHIGIYAFRREFLQVFSNLPAGKIEKQERLEQLRALENGYNIQIVQTQHEYLGIDTPEEYRHFVALHEKGALR